MMNIYLQELRAHRKFIIIWSVSLISLLLLYMSFFTAIAKDADAFIKVMESYPEELKNAMGMQLDSIASLLGFYSFVLAFIILCGAIQAMNIGISIVSKEVRERTADFLMTKPISRIRIMTEKLLAALTTLLITNVLFLIVAIITANIVKTKDYDMGKFILMTASLFLVQLMFFASGILLSVILPKIKSVLSISLGIVFVFYAFAAFAANDSEDWTRYLTPFKYFDTNYIRINGKYETSYLITALIFIAITTGASYVIFKIKNIHAV